MSQEVERVYTIPLGKVLLSQSQHRAVRAINMIREFARHHMKVEDIRIEEDLAHQIWARGVRSPPRKVRVRMSRTDEGYVLVSPYDGEDDSAVISEKEAPKVEDKVEEPKIEEPAGAAKVGEPKADIEKPKEPVKEDPKKDAPAEVPNVKEPKKQAPKEEPKDAPAKEAPKEESPKEKAKADAPTEEPKDAPAKDAPPKG